MRFLKTVLFALLVFASTADAGPRGKEIGIVEYLRSHPDAEAKQNIAKTVECCGKAVKETGLSPEGVDVSIFLRQNKAQRDQFKRILIPCAGDRFTPEMHEGMDDYVRSGGLLITNSSLLILDAGVGPKADKGIATTDYPMKHFLGVRGHSSCLMRRIKVLQECPLTKGLETNTWVTLEQELGGRDTRNCSAEVVVVANRVKKAVEQGEQPFLTYKHQDKGACIYLVGQIGEKPDRTLSRILANICCPETIEWLCLQE
jgi:hypothetical protein